VVETPCISVEHFLRKFVSLHIEWTKFSDIQEQCALIIMGVIALTFAQKSSIQSLLHQLVRSQMCQQIYCESFNWIVWYSTTHDVKFLTFFEAASKHFSCRNRCYNYKYLFFLGKHLNEQYKSIFIKSITFMQWKFQELPKSISTFSHLCSNWNCQSLYLHL
jgi:hypothetical protein